MDMHKWQLCHLLLAAESVYIAANNDKLVQSSWLPSQMYVCNVVAMQWQVRMRTANLRMQAFASRQAYSIALYWDIV